MDFSWTDAQQRAHERLRALGTEVARAEPHERLRLLAAAGALGLAIDEAYGGGGLDLVTTAYGYEALGQTLPDGGTLLAAGAHLFGVALVVQKVGTAEQKDRWLADLAAGARIGTVAATEPASGTNIGAVQSLLEPHGDGLQASGDKCYVTNAAGADLFLFVGRAGHAARGLTTAMVAAAAKGVQVGPRLQTIGLQTAGLAPVTFRECAVDAGNVLGRPGAGMAVFQMAMTFERALVLAFRLGAMQRALDEAVAFARQRKLPDRSIVEHQAVAHRLARMKLRLDTARLLVYRTAWALDRGERAQGEAALAKWHLAECAVQSALDAVLVRGAAGFLEQAECGAAVHDALGGSIHSGTQDVLPTIVARSLLG